MSVVAGSVPRSTTQKLSETPSVLDFAAPLNGTTSARAAFQNALNKTVPGGTLLIPKGKYLIDYPGTGTECLLCPKPIHLKFETGAQILVAASVPSTVDVLRLIAPVGGPGINYRLTGMYMLPVSGTPGRYGLNIDVTAAPIFQSHFDGMRIEQFGTNSMAVTFPSTTGDGFFTSQFRSCYFGGGIFAQYLGDSVSFWHCTFYGDNLGVDLSIVDGAHQTGFYQCNATSAKGFLALRRGDNVMIRDCNLEGIVATAGTAEPAVIHIEGTAAVPCNNVMISGNCITTLHINRAIKIDYGVDCEIQSTWMNQGAEPTVPGTDERIWITPNALRTRIGRHIYLAPVGFFDKYKWLNQSATTIFDEWDSAGDGKDGNPPNLPNYRVWDLRTPTFGDGAGLMLQGNNSAPTPDRVTYAGIKAYARSGVAGSEQGDLSLLAMRLGVLMEAGRFLAEGGLTTPQILTLFEIITAATPILANDRRQLLKLVGTLGTGADATSGLSIDFQLTTVPSVRLIAGIEPQGFEIWTSGNAAAGPVKRFSVDGLGITNIFTQAIPAGATATGMELQAPYASGTSGHSIDFLITGVGVGARVICRAPGSIEFWTTSNASAGIAPIIMFDTVGIKIWSGSAWVPYSSASLPNVGTPGVQRPLVTTDAQGRVLSSAGLSTASAAATSALTLTGTMADVPGATVSLVAGLWMVTGVFEFNINAGGAGSGSLNVGGTSQTALAVVSTDSSAAIPVSATQTWIVTVVGTQTAKLQASIGGLAAGTCVAGNTTINCVKVG